MHYIAPKPSVDPDAAETRRERWRYFGFAAAVGVLLLLNLTGVFKTVLGIDTAAILTAAGRLQDLLQLGLARCSKRRSRRTSRCASR